MVAFILVASFAAVIAIDQCLVRRAGVTTARVPEHTTAVQRATAA